MAKRLAIPSKELQLKIVGPRDAFLAHRVQRINTNTDIPTTVIDEHGNRQHVGTSQDTPNLTLTFSAFDVGIKIFSVMTGTNWASYPAGGVDIGELGEVDAVLYVKDASLEEYAKSAHARRLQVRDFAFSYSVDGESTEDYTLIGSERRWFKNNVIVEKFTAGTTSFVLGGTPVTLKNGNELLSVILDGVYLEEATGALITGQYSITGTTITTFDTRTAQVLVVYQEASLSDAWADVDDQQVPAAIRGRDVKVIILAEEIPRVQSVSLNGTMNVSEVREMGNRNIVGYQSQVPTVNGTITVLDTDLELIALLTTGAVNPADTEFQPGIDQPAAAVPLTVLLYDPMDNSVSGILLKTIYIPELRIVGEALASVVNDNVTQTWNWESDTAECIIYSGAKP